MTRMLSLLDRHPASDPALLDATTVVSFGQLRRNVETIAAALKEQLSLVPGQRWALMERNTPAFLQMLYALMKAGAIPVPINVRVSPADFEYIANDSGCTGVIAGPQALSQDPSVSTFFDTLAQRRELRLPELGEEYVVAQRNGPIRPLSPSVDGTDVVVILYTTGSTGVPKGVLLRDSGIAASAHRIREALRFRPGDRFLSTLPFYHVGGIAVSLGALHGGAAVCPVATFSGPAVYQLQRSVGITTTTCFNTHLFALEEAAGGRGKAGRCLSNVRAAYIAGSPSFYDDCLRTGIAEPVFMYGLTEASSPVSHVTPDVTDYERRKFTCGRPVTGVEVKIVDPDSGAEKEQGQTGEILFRGPNRCAGYVGAARVAEPSEWCRTGDLGHLTEDGFLVFDGRTKFIVKSGGENVSVMEVERALEDRLSQFIKVAQVVGVPDDRWGEMVVAVFEAPPGAVIDEDALRQQARTFLPGFKVPKRFLQIEGSDWPLTANGKILRPSVTRLAIERLAAKALER